MYTIDERIVLVNWYKSGMSLREVSEMFSASYRDRPIPSPATISRIVQQFEREGCIIPAHSTKKKRAHILTEEVKLQVLLHVENNKNISTKSLAHAVGVSKTSVHRILKSEKFRSFHYSNHQELIEGDQESRMDFSFSLFEKINNNEVLLHNILFTDEATFILHGEVNRQNFRYWSRTNLHLYHATRTQRPQKVNVWAGILGTRIIGPFFIEGNLTGQKYLELLQNQIVPALQALDINVNEIWYQMDGAPPHSTMAVRNFLEQTFPHRWIGRGGELSWPPRSPDLTPKDYFYWGYLKSKVYNGELTDIAHLRQRILQASNEITETELNNVISEFYDRLIYCMQVNGGIFENLLG